MLFFQNLIFCWQNSIGVKISIGNARILEENVRTALELSMKNLSMEEEKRFSREVKIARDLLAGKGRTEAEMYSAVGRMDSVGRRSAGSGKYGNTRTARKRHWRSAGRLHGSGARDLQDIWKNCREVRKEVQKEVRKEIQKEVRKQLQAEVQQNFRRAAWCIWNREKEKKILQWNPGKPRRSKKY